MAHRILKRRRLNDESAAVLAGSKIIPSDPLAAATEDDKKSWKGFCEIESEPVRPA